MLIYIPCNSVGGGGRIRVINPDVRLYEVGTPTEASELIKKNMSKEMPSEEQIAAAEAMISPQDARLTETREEILKKIKERSGLDEETFNQIVESIKFNVPGVMEGASFEVRGHKVEGLKNSFLKVDGVELDKDRSDKLLNKYANTLIDIMGLSNSGIERRTVNAVVEDLLK